MADPIKLQTEDGRTFYLKQGHRRVAFQASYAMRWSIHWAHIFVDCVSCDLSIGIKFDYDVSRTDLPDDVVVKLFQEYGWVVEPGIRILCPACKDK